MVLRNWRRCLAALLATALFGTMAALPTPAAATPGGTRVADADTRNDYTFNLGGAYSTLLDGRVWTDKSVSTTDVTFAGDGQNIVVPNDSDFLVTYSALATSTQIISQTTAPVDVVFVLDFSASMAWGRYENGRGTVTTQAESRVQAMVDGINDAIDILATANGLNRVGIVVFNRGAETMLDLSTVAPRQDKDYLEITRWNATPGADDGNNGNVQVTCNINSVTLPLDSYTNIHAGVYQGMQQLLNASDTDVEIENQTFTRVPNLILMSDGAPTTFSRAASGGEWWNGIDNTPIGSGDNNTPHSGNGFLPLVTAAYFKNAVTAHYYPNAQPDQHARVFTIGFMTAEQNEGMRTMADLVLEPARYWDASGNFTPTQVPAVDAVNDAWQQYRAGTAPTVQYSQSGGESPYTVDIAPQPYNPTTLNYPDAYFAANDADDLWNAFRQIVSNITSLAQGPTQVEGNDPVHSGYILYLDQIGQYMQINTIKTILWAGIEFDLDDGFSPAPEPQPDGSVRYTYTGHFSTESGGKTFDSPVYGRGNIDDILVTVQQDTQGNQTLQVAVPASAIPIRVNSVTLDANGDPVDNVSNNAYPLRVCYTVGLKAGVLNPDGTLNTNPATGGVSAEYLAANTDPATNQVYFYANLYTGNREGDETVGNATVRFDPASTNPFYFLQENTPLYTDPDCTVRADSDTFQPDQFYYFRDEYYAGEGSSVTARTLVLRRLGSALQNSVGRDDSGWYIRANAPRLGNLNDLVRQKGAGNATNTAQTSYYPTYEAGGLPDGWINAYQGNNGRLALAAPASLTIAKQVNADAGLSVPAGAEFHFTLSIPSKAGQTLAVTRRAGTDTAQEQLVLDGSGSADFALRAGEQLTIPDMQNTAFTVTEDPARLPQGFALDGAVSDPAGIGSFDPGTGTFAGTLGAEAATVTFTNTYRAAFDPGAEQLRIPVRKTLEGYRTDWQPGESYTFRISPSSRADNNRNAALPLTATTLTLTGAMPSGNFVIDLGRLLDADTLAILHQRAAVPASTAESASPETAAPAQTPESALPTATQEPLPPSAADTPDATATPETAPAPAVTAAPSAPDPQTPENAWAARLHAASRQRRTLAGLTQEEAARLDPQTARALLDSIPGTYYYTITEDGDAAELANQNIIKDQSRYEAAVVVSDDGAGNLTATLQSLERVADRDGTPLNPAQPAGEAAFANRTTQPETPATPAPGTTPAPAPGPDTSATATATPRPGNPAAGDRDGPPATGDSLPIALAAALLALSGLALAVLTRRRQ